MLPALGVFSEGNLQRIDVERLFGNDPLQPSVLVLEVAQFACVVDLETTEFPLPPVERELIDPKLAPDVA